MKLFIQSFIFLLLTVISLPKSYAQQNRFKQKKYVFLLDVTKSMWGCCGAHNIFNEVRNHLIKAITNIPDSKTEIVISTYQEKIINTWRALATPEGKKLLITNLNNINEKNVPGQNTNAYGAWLEAKKNLDVNKINIVFLLTDGDHNDKNVPIQKFYDEIPKWENISNKQQAYMFIVELTKLAIDNKVRTLVKETKDVQIIHGIEFFVLEINQTNPVLNINDGLSFKFDLTKDNWDSKYDNLPISFLVSNPYFELKKKSCTIKDLPITLELTPKISLAQIKRKLDTESTVIIKVNYPNQDYPQIKILNNQIDLRLNNKKEKVLYIEVSE